jgi:dipeptidase E
VTGSRKYIEGKVYLGVSAGSIVMGTSIEVASIPPADPNLPGITDLSGLGIVDFEIEPHCDAERFSAMEAWASEQQRKLYALDDQSAIKIIDSAVELVGEGNPRYFA